MKNILVTGGAGYIGSFIVRELKNEELNPIIIDDLSSGHLDAVKNFELIKANLITDIDKINTKLKNKKIDGVIHMASFIQMGESFRDPSKYFHGNLNNALNLLDLMVEKQIKFLVFSSSAGVYGNPEKLPITEDSPKTPQNPYGETKLMIERMLHWYDKAHDIKSISIRYFNAAGAAPDGSIGEDHPNESHIIPIFIKKAMNGEKATIFGKDYNTPDGTCVRDYVHVLDLARAHTKALKSLVDGAKSNVYNAGTGKGHSNKEIVDTINKVTNLDLKVEFGQRRPGDADQLFASVDKIKKELNWKSEYSLEDIINSAYAWHKKHPNGYKK